MGGPRETLGSLGTADCKAPRSVVQPPPCRGQFRLDPFEDRRLLSLPLLLDAVDDYATAPDSAPLDLGVGATDDFTIEASFLHTR